MGPLTSFGIINSEWSLVVAFLIGIAFGFILEQAGFSTSRKLAGVFYGYDFVVLRVFFTAAVTAVVGLLFLGYFELIDLSEIYVNSLFTTPAIVGGIIMGFGFIIGGFCPGTSVCAAGIGKIDAMLFIGGMLLGVLVFAEGYPLFESLHKATPKGDVKIYETLGMSQGIFVLLLIIIALAAFFVTAKIEKGVKKVDY